eukprot:m.31858 g.31858  ORF g.31858 m.31858 type:complete len:1357 (-) comp8355_c0_seq1:4546-8616(-)
MKRVFAIPGKTHGNSKVQVSWQKKLGNCVATSGSNRVVHIWDRNGELKKEIDLPGQCVGMDWSRDGGMLAIIHNKSTSVVLWDANSDEARQLDTDEKASLSFVQWSKTANILALGTTKGALVLYNHQTSRKIPVYGKHGNKPIISGTWDGKGNLNLAGADRSCTISSDDGVTLHQLPLHGEPSDIAVFESEEETIVSLLVGKETLFMWNSAMPEDPIELEFLAKYGKIVAYEWFGDKKVLVAFNTGHFIIVSTKQKYMGQELFHTQLFKTRMTHAKVSLTLNKVATCGDDSVLIHDLSDPQDMFGVIKLEDDRGMLDQLQWSDDGQLLTVSTQSGAVYTYLTKLPAIGSTYGTRVCNLTALQEMSILDITNPEGPRMKHRIPVEPSFLAVGQNYAAAGLNNQAWFFDIDENRELLTQSNTYGSEAKTYNGTIEKMEINEEYAAVLTDGRVHLHMIEPDENVKQEERDSIMLPERNQETERISSFALTATFCIYATESGKIFYFYLEDWTVVNEYRHTCGIRSITPDPSGTRLAFLDAIGDGFLYNPANDELLQLPDMSPSCLGMFYDQCGLGNTCIVCYNNQNMDTYILHQYFYKGAFVEKLGTTPRPQGLEPLLVNDGFMVCLTASGRTTNEALSTHSDILSPNALENHPKLCCMTNARLGRYTDAFAAGMTANDSSCWSFLYNQALMNLEIPIARRCAQARGDAAAASVLASFELEEDATLLSGYVALMKREIELAEKKFLASSKPVEALWLHRDLLNWDTALDLAKKYKTSEIPYISRAYAQQLEFKGNSTQALQYFKDALVESDTMSGAAHNKACKAGIARNLLRIGDLHSGLEQANEIKSRQVWKECAAILQGQQQLSEAADLYRKSEMYDKAAPLYIRLKNWAKVGEILPNVTSTKVVLQYAKAKEADGSFKEAAAAYEQGGDFESVIRVNLNNLQNPDEAVRVVKESGSTEGAKMVAQFFTNLNDPGSAIQFLVLSGSNEDAFALAKSHGKMDTFAQCLDKSGSLSDFRNIAVFYDQNGNKLEAGRFYYKAGQFGQALDLLLQCDDPNSEHIEVAIDVIGSAREEKLTHKLINYIMGESDGNPKDAKYLFKLYTALKQFPEAARTAVIIAKEEQSAGNYRNAHGVLFSMHQILQDEGIRVPMDMWKNLMLLHSYIMVKVHVKRGDHLRAARLLVRVSNSISVFPAHIVNILTSTVIECWKAGLKNSAFNFAAMLMRPQYRAQIDAKFRPKIEKIVRKPDKSEINQDMVPSPYDQDTLIEAYDLVCPSTNNIIPFCIVTGRAMQINDWAKMPCCKFPALYSQLETLMESETVCPMCGTEIDMADVERVDEPQSYLRKFNQGTLETAESQA